MCGLVTPGHARRVTAARGWVNAHSTVDTMPLGAAAARDEHDPNAPSHLHPCNLRAATHALSFPVRVREGNAHSFGKRSPASLLRGGGRGEGRRCTIHPPPHAIASWTHLP